MHSVFSVLCQNTILGKSNHGRWGRFEPVSQMIIVSNCRACWLEGGKEQKREIIFNLKSWLKAAECGGARGENNQGQDSQRGAGVQIQARKQKQEAVRRKAQIDKTIQNKRRNPNSTECSDNIMSILTSVNIKTRTTQHVTLDNTTLFEYQPSGDASAAAWALLEFWLCCSQLVVINVWLCLNSQTLLQYNFTTTSIKTCMYSYDPKNSLYPVRSNTSQELQMQENVNNVTNPIKYTKAPLVIGIRSPHYICQSKTCVISV